MNGFIIVDAFLTYLAAWVISIDMAVKKNFGPWPQNDRLMNFDENMFFIIFLRRGALGTRPEALGTPGIDSTAIEKIDIFNIFDFLFFHNFSVSLHNPSFGTITGSCDPSRIADLRWGFIFVYLLSLLVH